MSNSPDDDEIFYTSVQLTTLFIQHYYETYVHKNPCMNGSQSGNRWVREVLQGNNARCYNAFRMDKDVFYRLCNDMETKFGAFGSNRTSHIEVVGMMLHLLGHGCGTRSGAERFQHSLETVSRYFGKALDLFYQFSEEIIKPTDPHFNGIAPEIMNDRRYMPHFKDCIGAIDGVHIPASISPQDQVPFIGRKGTPTQNVMAACNFDMQFIFACAGWEGSAHDTRVFLSVIRDPSRKFPHPPPGKYYVVDAGYPQMSGFLGPYKGPNQHFQQYRGRELRNAKEVFNHAHSSLRGVIERTFGVWKNKWHILRNMQGFSFQKQVKIVIVTMAIHNYIRRHAQRDRDFTRIGERVGDIPNGDIEMDDDEEEEYHDHRA